MFTFHINLESILKNVEEAPIGLKWKKAIDEEINALKKNWGYCGFTQRKALDEMQ